MKGQSTADMAENGEVLTLPSPVTPPLSELPSPTRCRPSSARRPESRTDRCLWDWAQRALGDDFTVTEVDGSGVSVVPGWVYYEGTTEWFRTTAGQLEVYDNETEAPMSSCYRRTVHFTSDATWRLTRALDSRILPSCPLTVAFPCDDDRHRCVGATFDDVTSEGAERSVRFAHVQEVCKSVQVPPYSTVQAEVRMKTCQLEEVPFKVDLIFSGAITARGYRAKKSKTRSEVKVGVAVALRDVPGFRPVQGIPRQEVKVSFVLEGVCSGHCLVAVVPHLLDLQSLV